MSRRVAGHGSREHHTGAITRAGNVTVVVPVSVTTVSPVIARVTDLLTIHGTGFLAGQAVLLGSTTVSSGITVSDSTTLKITVPSGVAGGLNDVSVGGVTLTNGVRMLFDPGYPIVSNHSMSSRTGGTPLSWDFNSSVASYSIVSDAGGPWSGVNIGTALFGSGWTSKGFAPINTDADNLPARTKLYLAWMMKLSPNWEGGPASISKIFHVWVNGVNHVYLSAHGASNSTTGSLVPKVTLQSDPDNRSRLDSNLNSTKTVVRGQWHLWELQVISNSGIDSDDGTVNLWLDSTPIMSHTDIEFTAVVAPKWTQVEWSPTWGGSGNTAVASDMTMAIDHILLSMET